MRRALLALPVALVLLAGCGTDPADVVRDDVRALTEAANDGDADAVRDRVDALLTTVAEQRTAEELTAEQAAQLIALAQKVRKGADVIDNDLLEQRRRAAEAAAKAAAAKLAEAKAQLEEERRRAEEAAREDSERGEGKGKGGGKDD